MNVRTWSGSYVELNRETLFPWLRGWLSFTWPLWYFPAIAALLLWVLW